MDNLNNILFINTGGGIGDALTSIPTLNYINDNLNLKTYIIFQLIWGIFGLIQNFRSISLIILLLLKVFQSTLVLEIII